MLKIKLAMCTKKEKTIKAYGTENSLRFFFQWQCTRYYKIMWNSNILK